MKSEIKLKRGEKFILFVYGIMAICSLFLLFKPSCKHNEAELNFEKIQSEILFENVVNKKTQFENLSGKLQKRNDVLEKYLSELKGELVSKDFQNKNLRAKIRLYADSLSYDSTLTNCDSLKKYSLYYVHTTKERDSICDSEIKVLHQLADNRDSAFFSCKNTLYSIDSNFQVLAQRHSQLADQLLLTQKNLRHSKRNARMWTGATLLLSGVTITLWMKNL